MVATLDDETYGCRVRGNQVKTLSNRKADTEGCSADVLADCYFRVLLQIRFCRRGVSQEDNIRHLLYNAFGANGAVSAGSSLLGGDRGCATMENAELLD